MNPRKVIRKITWILLVIAGISLLAMLVSIPYRETENAQRINNLSDRVNEVTRTYQEYLDSLAKKITSFPVEPRVIAEIQSDVLLKRNQERMFLWMNDAKGKFLYGAPPHIFQRLNQIFYKNATSEPVPELPDEDLLLNLDESSVGLIQDEQRAVDFNEFILKNVHRYLDTEHDNSNFRSFSSYYFEREPYYDFSQPVLGQSGDLIGTLYLKVDDSQNAKTYYSKDYTQNNDVFEEYVIPPTAAILMFSLLILWFLLPTWVYIDAKERGVKNPRGMALLSFFALPFGVIIYLITRPINLKQLTCPQCSQEVNGIKNYCPYCGFDFSSVLCPQCQYPVQSDWSFCPNCRAELNLVKSNVKLNEPKVLEEEMPA